MTESPLPPSTIAERRARASRRRRRQRTTAFTAILIAAAAAVAAIVWLVVPSGGETIGLTSTAGSAATTGASTAPAIEAAAPRPPAPRPVRLAARGVGRLPVAIQDAAGASIGGNRSLVVGGLNAADLSTDGISVVSPRGARAIGRLPAALHDAAAVSLGRDVYLFGGGTGASQLDQILRIDPTAGTTTVAGRLPAAASDVSAAVVGGTAYIVGGYTGTRWLDTIVAWRPGRAARIVARLPTPLRYAAVTAAGGRIVIAGGSTPAGTASDAVLRFDPRSGKVSRLGTLPAPTTHAAAAELDGLAYVIGGRGPSAGTPTDRIVAVDPSSGRIRRAGRLPAPLSDLVATTTARGIALIGGRDSQGPVVDISLLRDGSGLPRTGKTGQVPPLLDRRNVYAADAPGMLTGPARLAVPRIYVPNSQSNTVDVIDPATFKVVDHFAVGALPQHVTPAYDLKTLYVLNDQGNSITPIDPLTAKHGTPIPVDDPYNMYFTPDGRFAIVVAERLQRLDFRDAHTFRLVHSLPVPCTGVDHLDFSADGSYLIASCEFSSQLIKVDVQRQKVVGVIDVPNAGMPQDVKLSPDGKVFYVADMMAGGLWKVAGDPFRLRGFLATGAGAHGLYVSRDARLLYATNRAAGTISVISFATGKIVDTWTIPGGSPDMGGVSADGKVLWLSGRYDAEVYAISTATGKLLARIPVGQGPHGLCVWPQPGRYSLGHTGILR